LLLVGHIAGVRGCDSTVCNDLPARGFGIIQNDVENKQFGSIGRKRSSDCPANTTATARDDGNFSVQSAIRFKAWSCAQGKTPRF